MARRRYGSKAAYEAARGAIRDERKKWERYFEMSDEERTKERNREKLEGDEAMHTFMLFLATAMAGGEKPGVAAKNADQAISELKKRFT